MLFKILVDGAACHGGAFTYSLPVDGKPGEWTPNIEPVVCRQGYHLTVRPLSWYTGKARLYVAEYQGDLMVDGDKAAFESVRLVTEVTPKWPLLKLYPEAAVFLIKVAREADPKADISWADLSRADLSRAYLSGADLSRAYLSGAYLSGADLSRANLSGADLSRAYLSWANLSWANLSGAYLSGAGLPRAGLSGADLSGANLSRANLSGADLSGADLSGADLSGADLSWADLSGADLSGADLSGADLSRADLSGACRSVGGAPEGWTLDSSGHLKRAE